MQGYTANRLATGMQLPCTWRFMVHGLTRRNPDNFLTILNSYFVCNLKLWYLKVNTMTTPGVIFTLAFCFSVAHQHRLESAGF